MASKEIKLRDYQQELIDKISERQEKRILAYSETGSGKSVIIGFLANELAKSGRVLVLTHRIEILKQNANFINNIGILTADVRKVDKIKKADVVIAMAQTAHARFKKHGSEYAGGFDYVIVDEAHTLIFDKVYEKINYKKLIGFTATPNIDGYEIVKIDGIEYKKKRTLADYYDVLVEGVQTSFLIKEGYLTRERAYTLRVPNFDRLEKAGNDYSSDSLNAVYNNSASRKVLKRAYLELAKGKKTILFNSGTKNNIKVLELFKGMGVDAMLYDSVNSSKADRDVVMKWFKETKDGILINTGVFTTGLDVTDIECVIVNRATMSFNLWRQMVGRGARKHKGKLEFITIDLGNNIDAFGTWSQDVNWQKYFEKQPLTLKKKVDVLNIWECKNCGAYNQEIDKVCIVCGEEKDKKKTKYADKGGVLVEVKTKPIPPRAKDVIDYTVRIGEGASFAFKLVEARILELFRGNNIDKMYYQQNRVKLETRVRQIYTPIYFGIIKSKLKGKNRRLATQLDSMYNKINRLYL